MLKSVLSSNLKDDDISSSRNFIKKDGCSKLMANA